MESLKIVFPNGVTVYWNYMSDKDITEIKASDVDTEVIEEVIASFEIAHAQLRDLRN